MDNTNLNLVHLRVLAQHLRVPAKWLRMEAEAGRIPHLRAGSAFLFDAALVEALILQRARGNDGPKPADGSGGAT
jgi:hypothetical protein